MNHIAQFINHNIFFLNDIQVAHWQTESYAEHEALGEFYTKFNTLNDRFVEIYQGNTGTRIKYSPDYKSSLTNYSDLKELTYMIRRFKDDLALFSLQFSEDDKNGHFIDLESVLEDMMEAVSDVLYHLSLK